MVNHFLDIFMWKVQSTSNCLKR